jgi:nucleoid-associated protein YejK
MAIKLFHMKMCLNLNAYRDIAVGMYRYFSIVKGKKGRKITYCNFSFNLVVR